ncbi:hypothetical protein BH11CYA1_BH11CYA1_15460 [soil metagenome]
MASALVSLQLRSILLGALVPTVLAVGSQLLCITSACSSDSKIGKNRVEAGPKKIAAVRLLQESSVDGKFEVVASSAGMRLKSFKGGYELFSSAPDWQVYAVRADAKEVAHLSLAQWKKFYMPSFRMAGVTANFKTPEKTIVTSDSDGKKYQYFFPGAGLTSSGWSGWTEKSYILRYVVTARDFFDSTPVGAIVERYMNLPVLKGVPVSLVSIVRVGKREEQAWTIRTISTRHEMIDDISYFRPPAKLKDAGEINSQFLSRGIRGLADDMSEMLDVREK